MGREKEEMVKEEEVGRDGMSSQYETWECVQIKKKGK